MTHLYNPGPSATYFVIPGVGEWPIDDPYPDRDEQRKNNPANEQE